MPRTQPVSSDDEYIPITGFMAGDVMSGIVTIWNNVWGGPVMVSMGRAGLETPGTTDTVIELVNNGIVEQTMVIAAGQNWGLWSGTEPIWLDNGARLVVRVVSGSGKDLSVSLLTYGFGMMGVQA